MHVRDLIGAVLRRVATEAGRVAGPVDTVTLTHPAEWGSGRRALLVEAARLAGFADPALVAEPVAAATYFAATQDLPAGACVLVYDLGAGTCDVTLLRRSRSRLRAGRLRRPQRPGRPRRRRGDRRLPAGDLRRRCGPTRRRRRQLWDDVRTAKEMLSRASGTVVMVPALGKEVPLGREQLEGLMRPVLRPTSR